MIVSTEVEAAVAYDAESVQRRGLEAITNFALDEYTDLLSERPFVVLKSLLARALKVELARALRAETHCKCEYSGWPQLLTAFAGEEQIAEAWRRGLLTAGHGDRRTAEKFVQLSANVAAVLP